MVLCLLVPVHSWCQKHQGSDEQNYVVSSSTFNLRPTEPAVPFGSGPVGSVGVVIGLTWKEESARW